MRAPALSSVAGLIIQTYNLGMVIKKLKRIGNSVGLILPRDLVAAADLEAGDEVTLMLHGRRIVIEPSERRAGEPQFLSAFEQVLRRHGEGFRMMAEYDRTGRRGRAR
jgi:antitoxin component of MazEF toxin-antitoxin module